jgi:hypothetical protein
MAAYKQVNLSTGAVKKATGGGGGGASAPKASLSWRVYWSDYETPVVFDPTGGIVPAQGDTVLMLSGVTLHIDHADQTPLPPSSGLKKL